MKDLVAEYELYVHFEKDSSNPQRIFKTLTRLIESLDELDNILSKIIDNKFRTELVLEDIQAGSLRNLLRVFLENLDETGVKELDWKKIVGGFLNKARLALINHLKDKDGFTSQQELKNIQIEIDLLAHQTQYNQLNAYGTLHKGLLADIIDDITKSLKPLGPNDYVEYRSREGNARFNPRFKTENLSKLVSEGEETTRSVEKLRIKKADLLGESKWEFKLHQRTIEAKIIDTDWLNRFHNGEIMIKSGDLLEVDLLTEYIHGPAFQYAQASHTIQKVVRIISGTNPNS